MKKSLIAGSIISQAVFAFAVSSILLASSGAHAFLVSQNNPTKLTAPSGYTSSQLIFDDKFLQSTLNSSSWNPWMGDKQYGRWGDNGLLPNPYSSAGNAGGYDAEYDDPYPAGYSTNINGPHTVTGNGLRLIATPSNHFSGYTWAAAAICTEGKVSVPATGGYVQFRAKMPDSRYGAWGGLWLLDGTTSDGSSSEIDLMESGYIVGTTNPNYIMASNLHSTGNSQIKVNTGVDLSAAYHIYGVEYNPGNWVKMYLDGALMATYTSTIPTGAYEIIMNVEMAQGTSGWHTLSDIATNPGPFEMDVSEVQVYSLSR